MKLMTEAMTNYIKRCTLCGVEWTTKEDFLADQDVRLVGYQWDSRQVKVGLPSDGVLVFTHAKATCKTSLSVAAVMFRRESQ